MKLNLKILFLLLTVSVFSQNKQEGIIFYAVKSNTFRNINKKDTLNQDVKNALKRISNKINEAAKTIKFELKFNKSEALFTMQNQLELDNGIGVKLLNKGIFYTDTKGNVLLKKEAYGSDFLIENPINNNNWKLVNETKTINGFNCYKALNKKITYNRFGKNYKTVVAWYAPKLPIRFGPEGFGNLPGLIIQLSIEKGNTYTIEKIRYKNGSIKKPTKGKKVTLEEFGKIGKRAFENMKKNR